MWIVLKKKKKKKKERGSILRFLECKELKVLPVYFHNIWSNWFVTYGIRI